MKEYLYYIVLKNDKPIFRTKFEKGNIGTERDMTYMLDVLSDNGYYLKSVDRYEYSNFDYSNVDNKDISDFMQIWSYFEKGGQLKNINFKEMENKQKIDIESIDYSTLTEDEFLNIATKVKSHNDWSDYLSVYDYYNSTVLLKKLFKNQIKVSDFVELFKQYPIVADAKIGSQVREISYFPLDKEQNKFRLYFTGDISIQYDRYVYDESKGQVTGDKYTVKIIIGNIDRYLHFFLTFKVSTLNFDEFKREYINALNTPSDTLLEYMAKKELNDKGKNIKGFEEIGLKEINGLLNNPRLTQKDIESAYYVNFHKELRKLKANIEALMSKYRNEKYIRYDNGGLTMKKQICPVGTEVQTLIFSKEYFNKQEAKNWAKRNDFRFGYVDEKENTFRIRQQEPEEFTENSMRTISFRDGIKAVIGCPKVKYEQGGDIESLSISEVLSGTRFSDGLKKSLITDFENSGYSDVIDLFADTPEKLPLKQKIWATAKNIQEKVKGFDSGKNTYLQAYEIAQSMYNAGQQNETEIKPTEKTEDDNTVSGFPKKELIDKFNKRENYKVSFRKPENWVTYYDIWDELTYNGRRNFLKWLEEDFVSKGIIIDNEKANIIANTDYRNANIPILTREQVMVWLAFTKYAYSKADISRWNKESQSSKPEKSVIRNLKDRLLKDFEEEKPSIALQVISDGVADSILSDDYKEKGYPELWQSLSIEQKTKYNDDYKEVKDKLNKELMYGFLKLYYSNDEVKEKCKGQSEITIDIIKSYLLNTVFPSIKNEFSFPVIEIKKQETEKTQEEKRKEIEDLIEVLKDLANEDNEEAKNLIETLQDLLDSNVFMKGGNVLHGGKADYLNLIDIAKKHKVDLSFLKKQFNLGLKVESEHSGNKKIQSEIAKDHLSEFPNYYTELVKMEKTLKEQLLDGLKYEMGGNTDSGIAGRYIKINFENKELLEKYISENTIILDSEIFSLGDRKDYINHNPEIIILTYGDNYIGAIAKSNEKISLIDWLKKGKDVIQKVKFTFKGDLDMASIIPSSKLPYFKGKIVIGYDLSEISLEFKDFVNNIPNPETKEEEYLLTIDKNKIDVELFMLYLLSSGINYVENPSDNSNIRIFNFNNERDLDKASIELAKLQSEERHKNMEMPKNLNQLKSFLKIGLKLKIKYHRTRPDEVGKIREITIKQTNSVAYKDLSRPNSDLVWFYYPKPDLIQFSDNGFSIFNAQNDKIITYEYILDKQFVNDNNAMDYLNLLLEI